MSKNIVIRSASCLLLLAATAAFPQAKPANTSKTIKPITPIIAEAPMPFCRVIKPNCPF